MGRRTGLDAFGVVALIGFAALFGSNQVAIKVMNDGFQPVFAAALRSVLGGLCIWLWLGWRGRPMRVAPGTLPLGLLFGAIFAVEFLCLFVALDHTTVVRATVIFYSMPVWLSLAVHVLVPGERIGPVGALGLVLAFAGMVLALIDVDSLADVGGAGRLGDALALVASMLWAALAFMSRGASARGMGPEMQVLWMVAASAPLLMLAAPFFGPLLRDPGGLHLAMMGFQVVVVVCLGFLGWFWMLSTYPAASVASFTFLSPLFGMAFGWLLLGEPVTPKLLFGGVLVAAGLVLINRPAGRRASQG